MQNVMFTVYMLPVQTMREKLNFRQYVYSFVVRAKPFLADKDFLTSVFNVSDFKQK